MKLWDKGVRLNKQIEEFTVGEDTVLDQKLVKYDCLASIAHAKMLARIGILAKEERQKLEATLNQIIELDRKGEFQIQKEQEDCHTAIENHLVNSLGKLGEKIHTGRSRNDQVLTALRLFCKDELQDCSRLAQAFMDACFAFVEKYGHIAFPGYTHTRKAMPSSIALWGQACIDSMKDNLKLLDLSYELVDQSPLGAGAGYGVPLALDREFTAKQLGFKKVQTNPIYSQNSRGKFESTMLHSLSQILLDLNKISSDLITFSQGEFGYFELPDEFCTGSSIMPQKKNPDVLELVRANYHVVLSFEYQIKNIAGNLISGYHRDMQLSKEPTIKGLKIAKDCISIMTLMFKNLKVNEAKCQEALTEEIYATERVYELVNKGVPFREAYKRISKQY